MIGIYKNFRKNIFAVTLLSIICESAIAENEIVLNKHDLAIIDKRVHESFEYSGLICNDNNLENAIYKVLQSITRSDDVKYQIKLLNNSDLNAFSLSDGTIYISIAMLGLIDNEAQLAYLLAHEMSHIELDHHRKFKYELHEQTLKATKNQIVASLFGVIISAYDQFKIPLAGFSRLQEYETDSLALEKIVKSGYNGWDASELFLSMFNWMEHKEKKIDVKYATHPQFKYRYEKCKIILKNLQPDPGRSIKGEFTYHSLMQPYYNVISNLLLSTNAVRELYWMLNLKMTKSTNVSEWHYLRGKIFELYHPVDSFSTGIDNLNKSAESTLLSAKSYRETGYFYLKNNMMDSAHFYLKKYLDLDRDASDASIVKYYLGQKND